MFWKICITLLFTYYSCRLPRLIIDLNLIDTQLISFFFFSSLFFCQFVYLLAKNVSLFSLLSLFFSRKIYVLRVACTPAALSRRSMGCMFIKENARPTVTILKNTSSSTEILINRLKRERKSEGRERNDEDEREDFSFICRL